MTDINKKHPDYNKPDYNKRVSKQMEDQIERYNKIHEV